MKRKIAAVGVVFAAAMIAVGALARAFDVRMAMPSFPSAYVPVKYLEWDGRLNRKQSGNTCGAHAAMACLYVCKNERKDPYEIYDSFKKLSNGYVLPWEITRYLRSNGIETMTTSFWLVPDVKKNQWIKARISNDQPVVVIIGSRKYLHYITVLGYGNGKYSVYDSAVQDDRNDAKPGNIDMDEGEIMKKMNDAVIMGLRIKLMITGKRPISARVPS